MEDQAPSKDIVEEYEQQKVRVFLINGASLGGTAHFSGNWLDVKEERTGKRALCNLTHTVSVTRD